MSVQRWVVGLLVMGSVLTTEANAQNRAVGFEVRGGWFGNIGDLNDSGTATLKDRGWAAGAGINFEFSRFVALRGDVTLARNELEINELGTGNDLSRLFYDASIQFQYPIKNFKPYIYVGAGAARLHAAGESSDDNKTTVAGTGGYGVTYTFPGTQLALGFEAKSWFYKLSDLTGPFAGYDKNQFEHTWGASVSYRIPLGAQTVRASR